MNEQNRKVADGLADACRQARELLSWARAGEEADGEGQARRHVEACPSCRMYLERRRRFDGRVAAVMRDVSVPDELSVHLQAALARRAAPFSAPAPISGRHAAARAEAPPAARRAPIGRRRLINFGAAAACAMLLGLGGWWFRPRPPVAEFDRVMHALTAQAFDAAGPPAATERGTGALPRSMSTRYLVNAARRVALERLDVELYLFEVPRGRQSLPALLAVLPAGQVRDAPAATRFLAAGPTYWGGYCTTAWREGDNLFVVCVLGNASDLKRLLPRDATTA